MISQPAPEWESAGPSGIPEEAAPSVFSRIPWRDILGRMHLLPPGKSESGETAESRIAAWWVIRIGLALLIIAAVFFGIYVSRQTPAWLRVLTLGLVLLAATGAFLFATRGWLSPFTTALVGSWAGFGVFSLLDWLRQDSPAFLLLMATLAALTVVFEAGNLVCHARGLQAAGGRLRRWLILGNTSAAALLGYGVTRLAHPDQLSTFYFIFAVLYFLFTVIHHLRTTDSAVTS